MALALLLRPELEVWAVRRNVIWADWVHLAYPYRGLGASYVTAARFKAVEQVREGLAKGGRSHHDFHGADIDVWHDPDACRICVARAALALLEQLAEAAEWALDVLEISLKRIDTIDGATLTDEHYRIRAAGLAKARAALEAVRAGGDA